jgi:hypothetical protein
MPGYDETWRRRPPFKLTPEYEKLGFYAAVAWAKPLK